LQQLYTIAIYRNQYHGSFPPITVIVDGGWSKCCHKHSYNSKSGVTIIIVLETRKILYLAVRNKYCSICNKATDGNIPLHQCFRNWDESLSAIIILKRFQESEAQHGLRYINYIGDGDSSVQPALVSGLLWGSDI